MIKAGLKHIVGRAVDQQKVRFALVGVLNTVVDFSVLFALVNVTKLSPIIANIISTSIALTVSYLLNKRSVFGNTDAHNPKQIVLFVAVTLSGLWILQNLVIYIVGAWLSSALPQNVVLFAGKLLASVFSLTWNYLWYSRVVFRQASGREVIK
jgi:putative flippase GtrA